MSQGSSSRDADSVVKLRRRPGRPRKAEQADDGMTFLGVRIPTDVHQRLYRTKARLEFSTGKFYGMGRLVERALRRGLEQIESKMNATGKSESAAHTDAPSVESIGDSNA